MTYCARAQTKTKRNMPKSTKPNSGAEKWRSTARDIEYKQRSHWLSKDRAAVLEETKECLERIENHSRYYKIRKYRKGKPGVHAIIKLDGKIFIRMEVLDGELVCSYVDSF